MSIANTQTETIIRAGIIDDNDQVLARVEHLKELEKLVGNSYPNKFERSFLAYKLEEERIESADKQPVKLEDTISRICESQQIKEIVKQLKDATPEGEKPNQELKAQLNEQLKEFGSVRISGRLAVPPRVMGKAAFVHLSDGINRLQIYVRKQDAKVISNDTLQAIEGEDAAWEVFKLLDHGDFIGVEGFLFLTNTGELSVHVETLQFLSKALMPMPDKMHEIGDAEISRRYRYIDLIASSLRNKTDEELDEERQTGVKKLTTREVFERRAKLISGMRRFLDDHDYIEVETPMLTPKATGAAATPFATHHNALDIPLYARIAPELYLKRLTVGGFEKVYELNRNFRNEGLSHKHNPEFTMLEFYCAYMDVNGMMDFAEAMIKESVQKATGGSLQVKYGESEINFSNFKRWTMREAVENFFPESDIPEFQNEWFDDNILVTALGEWAKWHTSQMNSMILAKGDKLGFVDAEKDKEIIERALREGWDFPSQSRGIAEGLEILVWEECLETAKNKEETITAESAANSFVKIFENFVEPKLIQPTFIIDYPKSISPLSKASPENPQIAERFELFINGMECANGFSELNDPQEQYERFVDQGKERESGDHEAMVLDEDYIRALAYGMPPAAGIGIGIDRLVMLLTNKHSIRDVILFPHLRPEKRDEKSESEETVKREA